MSTSPHPPTPTPSPSVFTPIQQAIDRTIDVLFRPFDFAKWLGLGFCAWLAQLGSGTGGGGSNNIGNQVEWSDDDFGDSARREIDGALEQLKSWVADNLEIIWLVGGGITLLVIGVLLLVTWLSSRGHMMFVDGVIHDRGNVVEPWQRMASLGVLIGLIAFLVMVAPFGLGAYHLWTHGAGNLDFETLLVPTVLLTFGFLLLAGLIFGLIALAVKDFIVPLMWLRQQRVMSAWSELMSLCGNWTLTFVLYVIVRFFLGFSMIVLVVFATCATCCIAAVPYVGVVLLLPLHVFMRAYPLYFLGQFGPDYAPLAPVRSPAPAASAPTTQPPVQPTPAQPPTEPPSSTEPPSTSGSGS